MADPAFTFTDQIRPVCEIGMSDVREAEPDTWLDVSCHVHEVEIFRGRERFSDHFMPATASITFDNRSGWGDLVGAPLIVAGQTLRPARPIRVGVSGVFDDDTVESTRWLYRGWIDQATPAYDPVLHDVVTVNCIDAFGEAGQSVAPQGAEQGVNETVTARVNRVLDAVGWFPAKRKMATVATTVQGTPLGSRAVDLMTAAADSAGGVVFGDLDGDVVLKGADWMLYDPDDPPDGEIGNMDPGDPELEDVPVYVDPTEGTVYEPDPPPMERPPIVQFCVRRDDPEGTIVEQGDSWRIFVAGGQLRYESSGRVWDMGAYTGEGLHHGVPARRRPRHRTTGTSSTNALAGARRPTRVLPARHWRRIIRTLTRRRAVLAGSISVPGCGSTRTARRSTPRVGVTPAVRRSTMSGTSSKA